MIDNFPPKSWNEFREWLEPVDGMFFNLRLPRMHKMLQLAGCPLDCVETMHEEIKRAEKPFARSLNRMTRQLSKSGACDLEGMAPGALTLMDLKIDTAMEWASNQMANGKSLVPFPTVPFSELFLWLMGVWWNKRGRYAAVDIVIGNYAHQQALEREMRELQKLGKVIWKVK